MDTFCLVNGAKIVSRNLPTKIYLKLVLWVVVSIVSIFFLPIYTTTISSRWSAGLSLIVCLGLVHFGWFKLPLLVPTVVTFYFFSRFLESNVLGATPPFLWLDMVASLSVIVAEVSGIGLGYVLSAGSVDTRSRALGFFVFSAAIFLLSYLERYAIVST